MSVERPPASGRPRSFVDDWQVPATPPPPGTVANPLGAIRPVSRDLAPQPLGPRFRRLSVEDLLGVPTVDVYWGGIDLSPDGADVAFAWDRTGTHEIFVAPIAGRRIYQLTDSGERSLWPRWSPDGRTIAFLRDRGGDERFAIWLVDRDGKREWPVTDDPQTCYRDIEWSPDATRIACSANVGGGSFGVQAIDVATGERRALTGGERNDGAPRWSPDGKWIVFTSRRDAVRTNTDLYLVAASGGEPVRLDTRGGRDGESLDARWSPDGACLAFVTNARGRYEIALATLDDRAVARVEILTNSPFDSTEPAWRPDGRGIAYLHNHEARLTIRRVFAASHADSPIADLPGTHASPRLGPSGERVVAVFSSARRPWDIFVRGEEEIQPRPITDSLAGRIDPAVLVEPVHVRYSGADGREIPALLYVPHAEALADGALPPAIVYIHGGPTAQHFNLWDPTAQLLANGGAVVLAPNIRGSTGYGREFQEANRGDWGGKDLQDVLAGVEWLEREHIADGRRVGAYGGSYGGFMTLYALAKAPDRWAAGVSIVGVVSWKTLYDTTRGDLRDYLIRELGDPAAVPDLYRERSPLTHAAKIRAPLLILQGANDPRVPRSESEQVVAALRAAGSTFEYHAYPDEGHGFRRRENRSDALRRTADWFQRHLRAT